MVVRRVWWRERCGSKRGTARRVQRQGEYVWQEWYDSEKRVAKTRM